MAANKLAFLLDKLKIQDMKVHSYANAVKTETFL